MGSHLFLTYSVAHRFLFGWCRLWPLRILTLKHDRTKANEPLGSNAYLTVESFDEVLGRSAFIERTK